MKVFVAIDVDRDRREHVIGVFTTKDAALSALESARGEPLRMDETCGVMNYPTDGWPDVVGFVVPFELSGPQKPRPSLVIEFHYDDGDVGVHAVEAGEPAAFAWDEFVGEGRFVLIRRDDADGEALSSHVLYQSCDPSHVLFCCLHVRQMSGILGVDLEQARNFLRENWPRLMEAMRLAAVRRIMAIGRREHRVEPTMRELVDDPLARMSHDRQAWELLLDVVHEGRQLTKEELNLLDVDGVKAAFHHGLVERRDAERRILNVHELSGD